MRSRKKMLKAIPTLNSQHLHTHLPFIKITLLHSRRMTARNPPHLLSSQLSHLKQQVNPKMKRLPLRLNNRTNPRRSTILTQPTQSPTLHYVSHKNAFLNDQRSYPKSPYSPNLTDCSLNALRTGYVSPATWLMTATIASVLFNFFAFFCVPPPPQLVLFYQIQSLVNYLLLRTYINGWKWRCSIKS